MESRMAHNHTSVCRMRHARFHLDKICLQRLNGMPLYDFHSAFGILKKHGQFKGLGLLSEGNLRKVCPENMPLVDFCSEIVYVDSSCHLKKIKNPHHIPH